MDSSPPGRALRSGRPGLVAWLVWLLHLVSPRLLDRAAAMVRQVTARRPGASWRRAASFRGGRLPDRMIVSSGAWLDCAPPGGDPLVTLSTGPLEEVTLCDFL